jgi:hypothetical protein
LLEICLLKVNKDANHDIALFWVNQDWRDYPQKFKATWLSLQALKPVALANPEKKALKKEKITQPKQ